MTTISSAAGDRGRAARIAIVAAFFVVLVIPLIETAVPLIPVQPVIENRALAPWPSFESAKGVQKYLEEGERWFDDHFGFRPFFIRLATQIDYSVFNHSSRVHIGEDGWLYYRSVLDLEKPNIERTLPTIDAQVIAGVKALNRDLRDRGVTLIVAPIPLKDYFYPEFVPASAPRLPTPHRFAMLYDSLRAIDDLFFVDTIRILKETAKQRPIFHRTDFHWNDPAAFEVGKWIVDEIARREQRPQSRWTHPLKISTTSTSGGQANFMPLFWPPTETALMTEVAWPNLPRNETYNSPPFVSISRAANSSPALLPPMVVLGDSFFDGMIRSGFLDYFTAVYRTETNYVRLPELIEKLPPDGKYLMIEFIEVSVVLYDLAKAAPK